MNKKKYNNYKLEPKPNFYYSMHARLILTCTGWSLNYSGSVEGDWWIYRIIRDAPEEGFATAGRKLAALTDILVKQKDSNITKTPPLFFSILGDFLHFWDYFSIFGIFQDFQDISGFFGNPKAPEQRLRPQNRARGLKTEPKAPKQGQRHQNGAESPQNRARKPQKWGRKASKRYQRTPNRPAWIELIFMKKTVTN